jgi:hypothetical protein
MNYLNKVIVIFHFNGISTVNNCIYSEHWVHQLLLWHMFSWSAWK